MLRDDASAATELDGDFVYTICVKYQQLGMARYRIPTEHAGMIQLELEA